MKMSSIPRAAVGAIALPLVGGNLSGYVSGLNGSYGDWYESLKKPAWTPPRIAYPIVWTGLYGSMGYASYIVWKAGGGFQGPAQLPLAMYGMHLALNFVWSPIFFGLRSIKGGLITILMLDGAAAVTACLFYKTVPLAGYILVPYMLWLSLATALNYSIWKDNPSPSDIKEN